MNRISICEEISYIEGTASPLSADIGIVKTEDAAWLYDVGNGEGPLPELHGCCNVVLSHFHQDHIGGISRIPVKDLYLSKETYAHLPKETIDTCSIHLVTAPIHTGNLSIFPLPSSHAKGCLGLEVEGAYAFVGDALYCKAKKNTYVYNVQLLKEEIDVLKHIRAPFLLVSHYKGFLRSRAEVLEELESIYAMRTTESSEISIG